MKDMYMEPEMEIIQFEGEDIVWTDVITTSSDETYIVPNNKSKTFIY